MKAASTGSAWSRASTARRRWFVAVALVGFAGGVALSLVGDFAGAGMMWALAGLVLIVISLTTPGPPTSV